MSREIQESLPPALGRALQELIRTLEDETGLDRSRRASLLASAIVEFGAFETAMNGHAMDAARLIHIASELDRMSRELA